MDLNKLNDEELDAHKKKMDEVFIKNAKDPNSKEFVYDLQVLSLKLNKIERL